MTERGAGCDGRPALFGNGLWTQSLAPSYILSVVLVAGGGVVLDQQRMRRGVGVSYPACQNCGKRMRIVRRGPRYDHSGYYERQVFTCGSCDHQVERNINTDGTPRERPPHQSGSSEGEATYLFAIRETAAQRVLLPTQQLRQLGEVGRHPPRLGGLTMAAPSREICPMRFNRNTVKLTSDDLAALLRGRGGIDNLAEELGQYAARDWGTDDIGRPAARNAGGMGLLQRLSALLAARVRRPRRSGGALTRLATSCGAALAARRAVTKARPSSIPAGAAPMSASCRFLQSCPLDGTVQQEHAGEASY